MIWWAGEGGGWWGKRGGDQKPILVAHITNQGGGGKGEGCPEAERLDPQMMFFNLSKYV